MACCKNDLGAFPHNEDIDTGVITDQSGVHIVHLQFGGAIHRKTISLVSGQTVKINRPFNENFIYTFTIQKPDGTLLSVDACTTFVLQTYIALSDACSPDCQPYS